MTTALSFGLAIICYSVTQLIMHGKLKWLKEDASFWGTRSWLRKYNEFLGMPLNNWYYRTFKIAHREAFPLSATFLVSLTDGYHFMQFMFFNFIALSMALAIGFNWWLLIWLLIGVRIVHAVTYRILSK